MSRYELNADSIDVLERAIKEYQQGAEDKITGYLHDKGYQTLSNSIQSMIPVSDRKKKHAKNSAALMDRQKGSRLAVTVGTRSKFHYLYFPDDGTNTKHHAGKQHFFERGVEAQEENVINGILDALKFKDF